MQFLMWGAYMFNLNYTFMLGVGLLAIAYIRTDRTKISYYLKYIILKCL